MSKRFYTSIPDGYAVCQHSDCPMAETCLHQIVYPVMLEKNDILSVVNPNRCIKDAKCKFFRSNKPITYARGFAHFQKRMFPDQYDKFCSACIQRFGRNSYFMRRRGDTLMSPSEQQFIRSLLKQIGAPEDLDFTAYELRWNWNND